MQCTGAPAGVTGRTRSFLPEGSSRRDIGFITAVVIGLVVPGAAEGDDSSGPPVDLSPGWILLERYSDDFSGRALDGAKWDNGVKPWGSWTWDPGLAVVDGGRLRLGMVHQPHERDGRKVDYRAGIVRSKAPPIRYGYFEARIKAAPRWPGVATAFWLFRNTKEYWTEIDVVESMQWQKSRTILDHSFYVLRANDVPSLPVRDKRYWDAAWDPSADYHLYGALWTESEIQVFVDGRLIESAPNRFWHFPMDVVLSVGLRAPLVQHTQSSGFPTWAEVDYISVWGPPDYR